MPKFPYSDFQIEEIVQAEKHPRDWEPLVFEKVAKSAHSKELDVQLVRSDGRADRIRFVVRAGWPDMPVSYSSVLLLENIKIRGVDFHEIEMVRFYGKQRVPKGWHQDMIDPNLEQQDSCYHRRLPLDGFAPYDLKDFVVKISKLWNIVLLGQESFLL
jgi:hypothetical protein